MKKNNYYEEMIEQLPYGLERTVLRILQECIGKINAIKRTVMLDKVHEVESLKTVDDRQLREAIQNLRGMGVRICNIAEGKGYYIAQNDAEYQQWRDKYMSYAKTIWQTICSMDERRRVPIMDEATLQREVERKTAAVQPGLFG